MKDLPGVRAKSLYSADGICSDNHLRGKPLIAPDRNQILDRVSLPGVITANRKVVTLSCDPETQSFLRSRIIGMGIADVGSQNALPSGE
jgi:hypothetical protein